MNLRGDTILFRVMANPINNKCGGLRPPAPPDCVKKHSALRSVPTPPPAANAAPYGDGGRLRLLATRSSRHARGLRAWLAGSRPLWGRAGLRRSPARLDALRPGGRCLRPACRYAAPLRGRRRLRLLPFGLLCIVNRNVACPLAVAPSVAAARGLRDFGS